jgi:hypothetical protein
MQTALVSDVLKSMRAAGPEAWGLPIGTGEFAEILVRLDRQRDGFDGDDVARVEAMWTADIEPDFAWTGGFVMALKDGRRVYVSGDATPIYDTSGQVDTREMKPTDEMTYTLDWSLDARFLGNEPYHSVTPLQPGPGNPWPWREAPEDLNEFLRKLALHPQS